GARRPVWRRIAGIVWPLWYSSERLVSAHGERQFSQGEYRMEYERDDEESQRESHMRTYLFNKQVVTIGGGTGPFAVLSSLKRFQCAITAIVTMSDSGGSSRRLMDEFGQLPFGDLRQALVALSRNGALWRDVFTFRFQPGHGKPPAGQQ